MEVPQKLEYFRSIPGSVGSFSKTEASFRGFLSPDTCPVPYPVCI